MEKEPRKSAFSSSRKFYSSPFTRLPRSWFALSEESVREFFFHELVKFGFVPYFRSFVPRPNERNLFEWRRRWRLRNDNNSRKKKEIRIIEYSRRETSIERRFPPKKSRTFENSIWFERISGQSKRRDRYAIDARHPILSFARRSRALEMK